MLSARRAISRPRFFSAARRKALRKKSEAESTPTLLTWLASSQKKS